MSNVSQGTTVEIHYTGKIRDGSVFDTSRGKKPLRFTVGEGRVIPGLETAVLGMSEGESKSIEIPAAQAFGPHRKEKVVKVDRERILNHVNARVGQRIWLQLPHGQKVATLVTDVSEECVTLDTNHPLAGRDLAFDVELVKVA